MYWRLLGAASSSTWPPCAHMHLRLHPCCSNGHRAGAISRPNNGSRCPKLFVMLGCRLWACARRTWMQPAVLSSSVRLRRRSWTHRLLTIPSPCVTSSVTSARRCRRQPRSAADRRPVALWGEPLNTSSSSSIVTRTTVSNQGVRKPAYQSAGKAEVGCGCHQPRPVQLGAVPPLLAVWPTVLWR